MNITFKKATKKNDIKEIYDYNIDAFSDSPDFEWNLDEIKHEMKEGWELYGAYDGEEVVAALFFKEENDSLLTKNTAIKMTSQGSGVSHKIKEFFEEKARELGLESVHHYCRIDNFRMYSLNESHGYTKTPKRYGENGEVVEWIKKLK